MNKHIINLVAIILLVIGGINWGLIGLLNLNVIYSIFGSVPLLERLIYILIGLAAAYVIYKLFKKEPLS